MSREIKREEVRNRHSLSDAERSISVARAHHMRHLPGESRVLSMRAYEGGQRELSTREYQTRADVSVFSCCETSLPCEATADDTRENREHDLGCACL